MHRKMVYEATPEQLRSFVIESFDELRDTMPELYERMECELYEHIHGNHFTSWKYEEAVSGLQNQDGTVGPHWTVQNVVDYAKSKGFSVNDRFNEYDLAYTMNMVYSDYYGFVSDTTESYFSLAKAFLTDKDAPKGKAFLYYKAMRK